MRIINQRLWPSPRDGILEAYFYRSLHVFLHAIFSRIFIRIFPPRWFFALEFSMATVATADKGQRGRGICYPLSLFTLRKI
jgi:hypothetical protein